MQVKEVLLQKFLEVEQTAKEQAADNAILDQLHKVFFFPFLFEKTVFILKLLVFLFLFICEKTSTIYGTFDEMVCCLFFSIRICSLGIKYVYSTS